MTLANVGTEVKQFWRDIKETRYLMYNGTKVGGNNNAPGQGQGNKSRRQKKRDKKKAAGTKIIANVTEKDKDKYCFRRGDTSHRVKECIVQGDLKCDIHPNSKSNTNLACFYYRKANNMPTKIRPRPEGPKDITANSTTPLTGNSANLVIAKIDDEVDTTDVYTDDESNEETNAVELSDIVEDLDKQDYHTDSGSESEEDTTPSRYIPPTHPRPPGDAGAYRVILDKDVEVDSRSTLLIPKTRTRVTKRSHGYMISTHQWTWIYPKTQSYTTPMPRRRAIHKH